MLAWLKMGISTPTKAGSLKVLSACLNLKCFLGYNLAYAESDSARLPRSSSGLGHRAFIPEITGSTPVRGTERDFEAEELKFLCAGGGAQSAAKP